MRDTRVETKGAAADTHVKGLMRGQLLLRIRHFKVLMAFTQKYCKVAMQGSRPLRCLFE